MDACVFCRIAAGAGPAHLVAADAHTLAFLDTAPATLGHTIVVPRRHIAAVWDLTDDDGARLAGAVRVTALRLRAALEPDGLTITHSTGAAAGQEVPHVHVHLVPRWYGDNVRAPWSGAPADHADLAAIAEHIRGAG
ncbi:HIT family protein [Allonocardiopsis opalescens]|uniref:Histidine triad (HIT) family protein n=1 Tax=Allonocardiopsis opalescens TaxID=1144618 RepID=A0A2T0PZ50_9ACTN|nr:HIT domain-containing protein [Allonocardiopsis opalescens]PRX96801.1 histidine triad (HIT) family protein [Allonocardiopsis opalescens]